MAEKTPLKAIYNEDNTVKSLAEFTVADYIGVQDGGTGVGELGSIVSGDSSIIVTGGSGSVINNVIISFDSANLSFGGSKITGTLDGGSWN